MRGLDGEAVVCATGFSALDTELPGGGWPVRGLTEILQPAGCRLEWRLLLPALSMAARQASGQPDRPLILLAPPWMPHMPGLVQAGIDPAQVVWVRANGSRLLWAAAQVLKARHLCAVLMWLPHAAPAQLRRLQALALSCDAPVFVMRPEAAHAVASPAPLRVHLAPVPGDFATLRVQILKRRGPLHEQPLLLKAWPVGVAEALPMPAAPIWQPVPVEAGLHEPRTNPVDNPVAHHEVTPVDALAGLVANVA